VALVRWPAFEKILDSPVLADCCLSSRYVSENLNGRFIPGSGHFPDSEASGWSVPGAVIRQVRNRMFNGAVLTRRFRAVVESRSAR
jgi:hypothetical protein